MTRMSRSVLNKAVSRRALLKSGLTGLVASATGSVLMAPAYSAAKPSPDGSVLAYPEAFVYSELQISVPFNQAPWSAINKALRSQPRLLNKTWLHGIDNLSLGGFYAFDSIGNAQRFVQGYLPNEAKNLGVAHTSRIFDARVAEEASRDIGSPYFGTALPHAPGAFVYTEVQVNVPFHKAPWRERNPVLAQQPGLLAKTWLSGLNTNTLGGIDVFDSVSNARRFALEDFPKTARRLNAAFYTRAFDAQVTRVASQQMRSPLFPSKNAHTG